MLNVFDFREFFSHLWILDPFLRMYAPVPLITNLGGQYDPRPRRSGWKLSSERLTDRLFIFFENFGKF